MSQEARLKVLGLYTQPNIYSEVPQGALAVADNIVIDREGTATPRRGYQYTTSSFGGSTDRATSLTEYSGQIVLHYNNDTVARYNGTTYTDYSGTYAAPTDQQMRFVSASSNLYFTTNDGVKKLDSISATPNDMGVPKGIDLSGATTGSSGFLANGNTVAYRVVWGIKDANNNLLLSAPSQRIEVANSSGGTRNVALTVEIPAGITTSHFAQVYRSVAVASNPSDELFLVYEYSPTASQISPDKDFDFTDIVPEALLGASLYTNESQEGLIAANDQPPLAKDIAVYQDHMFFANTTTKYRFYATLLGVGGTNGLATGDTITVAGRPYIADTTFARDTSGTDAQNIANTARNLVAAVNADTSQTTVYAYYISSAGDLPGKILFEERDIGGSVWTVQVSAGTDPELSWGPEGLNNAQSATNDAWANGLFYSKKQQPEAVPILNYLRVGSASDPILRIVALRNSLFIFKQTEGIYRLSGTDSTTFEVNLFDSSAVLIAKNTLAVLNNQIYGLFSQGVCSVSETGLRVVSRQIEKTLLELQGQDLAAVKSYSWALGYESERKYILHTIELAGATTAGQAYVLNTFTNSWTRWDVSYGTGFVRASDDVMYVARTDTNQLSKERKSYSYLDVADEAITGSITAVSGSTITLVTTEGISVGDVLYQSAELSVTITAISGSNVTTAYALDFTVAACEIRKGFTSIVEWQPFSASSPMTMKRWREAALLFEQRPKDCSMSFRTDISPGFETVAIASSSVGAWGSFPWGSQPWGGANLNKLVRTYVTRNHQRAATITVRWTSTFAYSSFVLSGVQLTFNPYGEAERASR